MAFYKTLLFHTILLAVTTLAIVQSASPPVQDLPPQGGLLGKLPQWPLPQGDQQLPDEQNENSERRGPPQSGQRPPQGGQRPQSGSQGPPHGAQKPLQSGQGPPQRTTCNYTQEAGRTCRSCTQALTCLRNNLGFTRDCRGAAPYCRNGACSPTPSPACSASSTTPASTSADVASSAADVATTVTDTATTAAAEA